MSKISRRSHPDMPVDDAGASDPDTVPSTLDPDLEYEASEEIERELADAGHRRHMGSDDEIPEEEISEEVIHAAEELPSDTPVDRADQTDKRMENPPSGRDL